MKMIIKLFLLVFVLLICCSGSEAGEKEWSSIKDPITLMLPDAAKFLERGCNSDLSDANNTLFRKILSESGIVVNWSAAEFCRKRADLETSVYFGVVEKEGERLIVFNSPTGESLKIRFSHDSCVSTILNLPELNEQGVAIANLSKPWLVSLPRVNRMYNLAETVARINSEEISVVMQVYPVNPMGARNILRQMTEFENIPRYLEGVCQGGKYFATEGYKKRK